MESPAHIPAVPLASPLAAADASFAEQPPPVGADVARGPDCVKEVCTFQALACCYLYVYATLAIASRYVRSSFSVAVCLP